MPKRPNRQVCQLCGIDEEVTVGSEGPDMWVFTCTARNQHHGADHVWRPTLEVSIPAGRNGIGQELGVYDDLGACVLANERVEYGVVEFRYAMRNPTAYRELVERYGHVSLGLGGRRYSASMFLAHALDQLDREGILRWSSTIGTGYWNYLTTVSAWEQRKDCPPTPLTSWVDFALAMGSDPSTWTPTEQTK